MLQVRKKASGEACCTLTNVRFGSEADIQRRSTNVRFTPESGHRRQRLGRPLSARSVRCRRHRQLLGRHALDLPMAVRKNDHSFKCDFGTQSTVRFRRSERRGQHRLRFVGHAEPRIGVHRRRHRGIRLAPRGKRRDLILRLQRAIY